MKYQRQQCTTCLPKCQHNSTKQFFYYDDSNHRYNVLQMPSFLSQFYFQTAKNNTVTKSVFSHSIYVTERGLGTMGTPNPRLKLLGMKMIIYLSSSCPQGYFAHSKKTSLSILIYKKLRSSCYGDRNIFLIVFPATCISFKIWNYSLKEESFLFISQFIVKRMFCFKQTNHCQK